MTQMVPVLNPETLVACVAEIDHVHAILGSGLDLPDVMVISVKRIIEDTENAIAALQRIQALVTFINDHPSVLNQYPDRARHLIPDNLTRAAAVTPLHINSVFDPGALKAAALLLMNSKGHA